MSYSDFIDQRDLARVEDFSTPQREYFTFLAFEKTMKKFSPFAHIDVLFFDDYTVVLSSSCRSYGIKITQSGVTDIHDIDSIKIIRTETIINSSDDIKRIFSIIYLHILLNY